MSKKHDAMYSDPTGAAAAASPAKRRMPRAKGSLTAGNPNGEREIIANLAYSYWESRGYTGGSAEEDWLRAEREVRKGRAASAIA